MTKAILVLNGPNLNMLGTREPEVYGRKTLADIDKECIAEGKKLGVSIECKQSNIEGELVGWIQQTKADAIVINAGAYTHTSVAIRDALLSKGITFIEVHISNVFAREEFRHHSFFADIAKGVVSGLGSYGYIAAIQALAQDGK